MGIERCKGGAGGKLGLWGFDRKNMEAKRGQRSGGVWYAFGPVGQKGKLLILYNYLRGLNPWNFNIYLHYIYNKNQKGGLFFFLMDIDCVGIHQTSGLFDSNLLEGRPNKILRFILVPSAVLCVLCVLCRLGDWPRVDVEQIVQDTLSKIFDKAQRTL